MTLDSLNRTLIKSLRKQKWDWGGGNPKHQGEAGKNALRGVLIISVSRTGKNSGTQLLPRQQHPTNALQYFCFSASMFVCLFTQCYKYLCGWRITACTCVCICDSVWRKKFVASLQTNMLFLLVLGNVMSCPVVEVWIVRNHSGTSSWILLSYGPNLVSSIKNFEIRKCVCVFACNVQRDIYHNTFTIVK